MLREGHAHRQVWTVQASASVRRVFRRAQCGRTVLVVVQLCALEVTSTLVLFVLNCFSWLFMPQMLFRYLASFVGFVFHCE